MKIRVSSLAQSDLDKIRRYTIEIWGREQWLKYYHGLVQVFARISADPTTGRDRGLFVEGMRSVNFEKHTIFFKPLDAAEGAPAILRIIYQRQHMPALIYYEDLGGA
jgi:toxin ParE1/3/4